jgi:RNA polymerase sigma-70 factor (ECF subfamily)
VTSKTNSDIRDEGWLENLFLNHHKSIFAYALRRVPEQVDEVVIEVFVTAWRLKNEVPEAALPWLYRVAHFEVMRTYRSQNQQNQKIDKIVANSDFQQSYDPVSEIANTIERKDSVEKSLGQLRPSESEILRMFFWDELSTQEIAEVLGCTTNTAKVRLHRAKKNFAKSWNQRRHKQNFRALSLSEEL